MEKILRLHSSLSRYDMRLNDWGGSALNLALRLFVGLQFFKSGLTKISDWGTTLALFNEVYHVPILPPALAAAMGTFGELTLPLLLFLGLLSRPAALGLFAVNLMAVISYPELFQFECPAPINDHFYWGILLLVVVAFGPGRWAIDSWFSSKAMK